MGQEAAFNSAIRDDPDDDLHRRNRDWLVGRDGFDVVTDVAGLAERLSA